MTRRDAMIARTAAVLWLIGVLFIPLSVQAENASKLLPGAGGDLCLTCHEAFQQKMKLRNIHAPIAEGQCSECHNPHASDHGDLLYTEPERICLECHDDLLPDKVTSVHKVVAEGNCTDCHDPHSSKNRDLLVASGEKLCFQCHAEVEKAVKESGVVHEPAEEGCLDCHNPHASADASSLLTGREPELCLECHDASDPAFSRGHLGYPVTSATCSVCHDPHGSNQSALLKDNVHSPVAKKMCGQCHKGDASSGTIPAAGGGFETCRECHRKTVDEMLESSRVHWPVLDKEGCLTCHDPHASNQTQLLREPMLDVCGSCHSSVVDRQSRSKTKHEPVLEGDCNACHTPHASDHTYLLTQAKDMDVCADCHQYQRHSTHPIGEDVMDPRNTNVTLDCSSCHRAHGTEYEHMFPFATYTFLCVQCHTDMKR